MESLQYFLPQVWFAVLALFLFLYVMLDGFDLGVGILSITASNEERRGMLMTRLSLVLPWSSLFYFFVRILYSYIKYKLA